MRDALETEQTSGTEGGRETKSVVPMIIFELAMALRTISTLVPREQNPCSSGGETCKHGNGIRNYSTWRENWRRVSVDTSRSVLWVFTEMCFTIKCNAFAVHVPRNNDNKESIGEFSVACQRKQIAVDFVRERFISWKRLLRTRAAH